MELSLQQIFDRARAAQEWLPPADADLVFAAAVRLAVEQGAPLRPSRLLLTPEGGLALAARDDGDDRPGYLAPELLSPEPPRRTEGRVQVFAAGALGYELFTGRPPPEPPATPGPELTGPLGDLVRVALSPDRRERFGDLQQLLDAVEVIQPRREALEKETLATLHARVNRWDALKVVPATAIKVEALTREQDQLSARVSGQEQALGRLAELEHLVPRVAALETALKTLKSQQEAAIARLGEAVQKAQAARAAAEQRAREDAETRAALAALHPPPSPFVRALGPALLGAVISAAVTAVVVLSLQPPANRGPDERQHAASSPSPADPASAGGAAAAPAEAQLKAPAAAPGATSPAGAPGTAASPEHTAEHTGAGQALAEHAAGDHPVPAAAPAAPASGQPAAPVAAAAAPSAAAPAAPVAAGAADANDPTADLPAGAAPAAVGAPSATAAPAAPAPEAKLVDIKDSPKDKEARRDEAVAKAAAKGDRRDAGSKGGGVSPAMIARAVARSQVDRGDTALEKGRAEEAIMQFRAAIENDADLPEAHRGLGMAYAAKNQDAQARKEYERYLALAPKAEDAADIRKAIAELRARSKLGGDDK